MFTLYLAVPVSDGTYAVLREDYANIGDTDPMPGSERVVSRNHTLSDATNKAASMQRQSYSSNRKEQADAQAEA